jgi:hypothetical protein
MGVSVAAYIAESIDLADGQKFVTEPGDPDGSHSKSRAGRVGTVGLRIYQHRSGEPNISSKKSATTEALTTWTTVPSL